MHRRLDIRYLIEISYQLNNFRSIWIIINKGCCHAMNIIVVCFTSPAPTRLIKICDRSHSRKATPSTNTVCAKSKPVSLANRCKSHVRKTFLIIWAWTTRSRPNGTFKLLFFFINNVHAKIIINLNSKLAFLFELIEFGS